MSRDAGKSGRSVTPEEAELWDRLTQTVQKAKGKGRVGSHEPPAPPAPPLQAPSRKAEHKPAKAPRAPAEAQPRPVAAKSARKPPPLAEFERRAVRQVASGKVPIDGRIDLHGLRLRDARAELRAFLSACQARGARTVLVITGKGGPAPEHDNLAGALGEPRRGVLRRSVPQWLEEPELRPIVLSYTTASLRHGGEGAIYVQLRKAPNRIQG